MAKKIKLIWDFRGADAKAIAEHHAVHLQEYASTNNLSENHMGAETVTPLHSIAFIVVEEPQMITVRDALKPHRGEFVSQG